MATIHDEYAVAQLPPASTTTTPPPTILLRVRRPRRGAITASSAAALHVELDAALAAADDAFHDWDIHTSSDDEDDAEDDDNKNIPLKSNDTSVSCERDISTNSNRQRHRHHRVSVSSRSRQSITSLSTTTSTAIFRRIDSSSILSHDASTIIHRINHSFTFPNDNNNSNNNKRPRILDAVLLDDDDVDNDDQDESKNCNEKSEKSKSGNSNGREPSNHCNMKKRRRLTLQILEPQKVVEEQQRRRSSRLLLQYPILSPQQRVVDDSLQQVFDGTMTLHQHCQLIQETVASTITSAKETSSSSSSDVFWPYVWCHTDHGNWLHAAAIWNEASIVREMFHFIEERFNQLQIEQPTVAYNLKHASLIREMIHMKNNEGFNPIQLAQLSCNSEIQTVLEHYYNVYSHFENSKYEENMSDDEHDYEFYSLVVSNQNHDKPNMIKSTSTRTQLPSDGQQLSDETDDDLLLVTNCELHNDCRGYWDHRGNLILEAPNSSTAIDLDLDANENHPNVKENVDVDDIDLNDEDWDGNDYPDDDHDFASDDDDDDDQASDNEDFHDFRRRHVNVFRHNQRTMVDCNNIDDSDEEDGAHYDPSYGDIYGQNDSLYY